MKRAGVAELKARLSHYLARVRGGDTVVVYDRDTPIARLVPYSGTEDDFVVLEATAPPTTLKTVKGIRPKRAADVVALLRESRDQR
jgi:prevent-host-death family protein